MRCVSSESPTPQEIYSARPRRGSIGEVVAAEALTLTLHPSSHPGHDAYDANGNVQIKMIGPSGKTVALCAAVFRWRLVGQEIAACLKLKSSMTALANRLDVKQALKMARQTTTKSRIDGLVNQDQADTFGRGVAESSMVSLHFDPSVSSSLAPCSRISVTHRIYCRGSLSQR